MKRFNFLFLQSKKKTEGKMIKYYKSNHIWNILGEIDIEFNSEHFLSE